MLQMLEFHHIQHFLGLMQFRLCLSHLYLSMLGLLFVAGIIFCARSYAAWEMIAL